MQPEPSTVSTKPTEISSHDEHTPSTHHGLLDRDHTVPATSADNAGAGSTTDAAEQITKDAELAAAHPELAVPARGVGAEPAAHLAKVAHARPMTSLDNGFSDEDVAEFVARIRRFLRLPDDEPVALTA